MKQQKKTASTSTGHATLSLSAKSGPGGKTRQGTQVKPKAGAKPVTKAKATAKAGMSADNDGQGTKLVKVCGAKGLHKRNKHQGRYNFAELTKVLPELKQHLIKTPKGEQSINFSDPHAVKLLNKALLARYYDVSWWDIPPGYLCPPIPGRADYIHRAAALLSSECKMLRNDKVRALDIGMGANCIYPIIAAVDYGWHCTGSDVDPVSVDNANQIASRNPTLTGRVECRLQSDSQYIFNQVIQPGEHYEITTCNPPFHSSLQEAMQGSARKQNNLSAHRAKRGLSAANAGKRNDKVKASKPVLNFGGQKAELWCPGGEAAFIRKMALESRDYASQVLWFTTLISKKENVRGMRKQLEKLGAKVVQIVEMSQGQKVSRFIAWTFHDDEHRRQWLAQRC